MKNQNNDLSINDVLKTFDEYNEEVSDQILTDALHSFQIGNAEGLKRISDNPNGTVLGKIAAAYLIGRLQGN